MFEIKVTHNLDKLAKELQRKADEIVKGKAMQMALNKVAEKGKAEMVRAITSEFALKPKEVRPRLGIVKASRKTGLRVVIHPFESKRGRSMNVIRFVKKTKEVNTARGTRKTIFLRIRKDGGVKNIAGAFIGNKGRTVFMRTGSDRTPIKPVQTIDVPQMFNTKRISERVIKKIEQELSIEVGRAAKKILDSK